MLDFTRQGSAPFSASQDHVHPAYRPDIDGLRAFAVLSVVVFHAFPSLLPGGFIGVDVFFVISGYLISTIIFKGMESGRFSLLEFYGRRIRRIFPALALVLGICLAAGWFLLLPDEYARLGKHTAASSVFLQNWQLRNEAGYFNQLEASKPLLHLWSLAIEEQFYLLFPLLIYLVRKLRLSIATSILFLGMISFYLNVRYVASEPERTFFLLPTRAWELLIGCFLASVSSNGQLGWIIPRWEIRWNTRFVLGKAHLPSWDVLSWIGLALLLISIVAINKKLSFPGWWALLPTVGTFLLLHAGPNAWVNRNLLACRPLVFIGLVSYPWYLWHWPLLSFLHIVHPDDLSVAVRLFALAGSFILAGLTYLCVERPLRFGGWPRAKTASLAAALSVLGLLGYLLNQKSGVPERFDERILQIEKAAGEWAYPGNLVSDSVRGIHLYRMSSKREATTLFLGDSNIEQYFPRMEALIGSAPSEVNSIIFKTGGGCLPIPGAEYDREHKHCSTLMSDALEIIKYRPQIDTIVIGAQWNGYLGAGYGMAQPVQAGGPAYQNMLVSLQDYMTSLRKLGKRVYLVLNIPTGNQFDPKYMIKRDVTQLSDALSIRNVSVARQSLEEAYGQIQKDLTASAARAGATVIDPISALCTEVCSTADISGNPIYKDLSHLRPSYVREHATFMDVTLKIRQ